ncbi:MAG: J domain-containing protein [Anaerolineae bacterium]|nr:J domain-containing protein [Anaerolineae bacterium]
MEYKDYYKILGVDKKADQKEIKKAFRRLAREYHPDVNPGDKRSEERFKEINEAHEVLSDPEKRARYDQLGANYQNWQRMGGQPGGFDWMQWASRGQGAPGGVRVEYGTFDDFFGGGQSAGGGMFSEFFQTIFGGMGRAAEARRATDPRRAARHAPTQGQHIEQPVQISLEEAYSGAMRRLRINDRRIEVRIPKGAKTGTRVRLSGMGEQGLSGGSAGDLFLVVEVRPHPTFRREGDDLHVDLPIDLYTAVLGGEVPVKTLAGEVALKIAPGASSGQKIRLQGRGMPKLNRADEYGDLYAHLQVKVPTNLSAEERDLFEQLRRLRDGRRA